MRLTKSHLLYWALYSCFIMILDYVAYKERFKIARELIVLGIQIWIFYSFLFAVFALKDRKVKTLLKALLLFSISFAGGMFLNHLRSIIGAYYGAVVFTGRAHFIQSSIIYYVQAAFYATGYFYAHRFSLKQKQLLELEKKQAESEKAQAILEFNNARLQADLMQSENDFLRSQINPHFLYNCLNFIYSRTFRQMPQVGETIMVLSQVMRYSLTDFSVTNGLAYMDEEILHINNVITINKLRYNDSLKIDFDVYGDPSNKMIAPMLLITLVENVFKHGNLRNKDFPATLVCRIDEDTKRLFFSTHNKRSEVAPTNLSFGMGHSNIKKRLSLLYKDDFSFSIKEEGGHYDVVLEMPYFDAGEMKHNKLRA